MARDQKRHGFPMPRTAFVLLLATNVLAVLPHLSRLPLWILPAFVAVLVWRIQVFRQRWPFPGRAVRLLLVMLGFAGVILHHGTVLGPDAGVGLLITAYLFKQLEMATRRDAFLVVILSYFVLATEFLFSTTLYSTLYVLLVLLVITATQVALNQTDPRIAVKRPLGVSLKLVLQSIPLMLVLFFLFPRIGPLWQLNLHNKQNFIGLSDRMSPGDISNLSRSPALAFRAEFSGGIPPNRERYWRAAVFDRFDGRTWHAVADEDMRVLEKSQLVRGERRYDYRVILEPTGQRWLMAMPSADVNLPDARATGLLTHLNKNKIDTTISYQVTSYPDFRYQADGLRSWDLNRYLQLPAQGNEQSRRYARERLAQLQGSPEQLVDDVMAWFNQEAFVYTLNPPLLGQDTIDEFLFGSRRGYCAHYAGAFVFLMRSAGVPARLVGGYQGGEAHPIGNYLLVHQYDAHAWAEVWFEGQGWVRVDPTAAVAPNRIELGSMDSTDDESFLTDSPLSPDRLRNLALFARARLLADYIDYLWYKNVVAYNKDRQSELFRSLLGQVTPQRIAALLGGAAGLIVLVLVVGILLRHPPVRRLDRADRAYLAFCRKLARKGLLRQPEEGPQRFADRLCEALPSHKAAIIRITSLYQTLKYAPVTENGNFKQQSQDDSVTLVHLQKDLEQAVRSFKL